MAKLGDMILPSDQPITGTLFSMLKLNPAAAYASSAVFARSVSPYAKRLASASNLLGYISYENTWLSTANANSQAQPLASNYAKAKCMLRLNPRIDKSPWPHGQRYVNVIIIISYQDGVGGTGGGGPTQPAIGYNTYTLGGGGAFGSVAFAPDIAYIFTWDRNTTKTISLTSGASVPNGNVQFFGFPSGNTVTLPFTLTSRNLLSGLNGTLTQNDNDPYTASFIQLDVGEPSFSFTGSGSTFHNTPTTRPEANNFGNFWEPRPLPGLSGTQIFPPIVPPFGSPSNLSNFFTYSQFDSGNPIGLVQTCSWLVGSWGWSTEINDSGTTA